MVLFIAMASRGGTALPESRPSEMPRFPASWYAEEASDGDRLGELSPKLGQMLDRLFEASSLVTNTAGNRPAPHATNGALPPDEVPWYLAFLKTDLALSASGLFGPLALQGSAAMSLRWKPKAAKPAPIPASAPTVRFSESTTMGDVAAQLDPIIEGIVTGAGIKDAGLLRASLYEHARLFLEYSQAIALARGDKWWVSGFRKELDIDVSGAVAPALSVGAQLTIRFEWERLECTRAERAGSPWPKLEQLVQAIAEDLGAVSEETFSDTAYVPHGMNIAVGVTASGDFGVVKASASLIGTVLFTNDVPPPGRMAAETPSSAASSEEIPILVSHPSEREVRWATAQGVTIERDRIGDAIFKIARWKFKRGLRRAARMGHFFAQRASRVAHRKWNVYELAINYQLSVSGVFGLVTVGGLANAELDLYNQKF